LLASVGAIYFTYAIARSLVDRYAGVIAAAILVACPAFLAAGVQLVPDTILICGCAAAVHAAISRKLGLPYLLILGVAALTKETALAFIVPCIGYLLWIDRKAWSYRDVFFAVSPLLLGLAFFLLEKFRTGNFSNFPFTSTIVSGSDEFFKNLCFDLSMFFYQSMQGPTALLFVGFIGLIFLAGAKLLRPEHILLAMVILCFWGGSSMLNKINARYMNPAIPCVAVLAAVGLRKIFPYGLVTVAISFLVLLATHANYWQILPGERVGYMPDHSLAYAGYTEVVRRILNDIEDRHPSGSFLTSWPYDLILSKPYLGYGIKARQVVGQEEHPDYVLIATNMSPELNVDLTHWVLLNHYRLDKSYYLPGGGYVKLFSASGRR
jgi:hypothetical protein